MARVRPASVRLLLGPSGAAEAWPGDVQTFSFDLDDDLAKLVTVRRLAEGLGVEVQYGRDHVLRHDRYIVPVARPPLIARTELGVSIVTTRPLLGLLQVQQIYRF